MTDLLHIIPEFPTKNHTHLIPSLEKHLVSTSDLLTLDALEIARRAQLPILDLRRLINEVISLLHDQLGLESRDDHDERPDKGANKTPAKDCSLRSLGTELLSTWSTISTLDNSLDAALGGGIPTGYITEITGESGAGKTQLLLTLLLSAQLPPPHGLSRPTLYISTEHALPTPRLRQLLTTNPMLSTHASPPSLKRILSIQVPDLESQDHILTYQLPVAISKHNIGLIVIDSIAANYRAEASTSTSTSTAPSSAARSQSAKSLAIRSADLIRTGSHLRSLARTHKCAVVAANQVSDRIEHLPPPPPSPPSVSMSFTALHPPSNPSSSQQHPPLSSPLPTHRLSSPSPYTRPPPRPLDGPPSPTLSDPRLSLDHQMRFFTGWGDTPSSTRHGQGALKTPALGLAWANQIACRVTLVREAAWEQNAPAAREETGHPTAEWAPRRWRRWARVVFAAWTGSTGEGERGVEVEVWGGGVRAVAGHDSGTVG